MASVPLTALPQRQDILGGVVWRGLRRLLADSQSIVLAPERGATIGSAPLGRDTIVLATASSTAATERLQGAGGGIGRVALHVPIGYGGMAQVLAAKLAEKGTRTVLLTEDAGEAREMPSVRIPNPGLLAGTPPADAPSGVLAAGAAEKRRALVLLHDPFAVRGLKPHPRNLSYQEYLRWEIARWLDTQAPKFDLHWIPLRSGLGQDDNKANLDVAMRMRHYQATHVQFAPLPLDRLLASMVGATLVVTSQPEIAYLALACRVLPLLVAFDSAQHAAFVNAGFADLAFEPFAFRAEAARARVTEVFTKEAIRKSAMRTRDEALHRLPATRAGILAAMGVDQ